MRTDKAQKFKCIDSVDSSGFWITAFEFHHGDFSYSSEFMLVIKLVLARYEPENQNDEAGEPPPAM